MKVLDYNKRRIPFTLTDATNSNKEDIEIVYINPAYDIDVSKKGIFFSDNIVQEFQI